MDVSVISIESAGRSTLVLVLRERLEIGRECEGLVIPDPAVSRRHLAVEPGRNGSVVVTDVGSSNGTTLRGKILTGPVVLARSESVVFGDTTLRVENMEVRPPSAVRPRMQPTSAAVRHTTARTGTGAGVVIRPERELGRETATSIEDLAKSVRLDESARAQVLHLDAITGGTLTFAFSDIESSTETSEALGDQRWFDALRRHNEIVRRVVALHGGTEIKAVGDGFMLTFPSATAAARCAAAVQRTIADEFPIGSGSGPTIRVRIGLHTGEAIEHDGDLFGKHVNVAARVANEAKGGEVLVSSLTRDIAQSAGDLHFGEEREVMLKGLTGSYRVVPLLWAQG